MVGHQILSGKLACNTGIRAMYCLQCIQTSKKYVNRESGQKFDSDVQVMAIMLLYSAKLDKVGRHTTTYSSPKRPLCVGLYLLITTFDGH